MVHLYYDFALQGRRCRAVGVLGLRLIMVHLYDDFALQRRRFRDV
jgi:hypothetical protein